MQDNVTKISGRVASELEKSYSYGKEDFYSFQLDCIRRSGKPDRIDVLVPQLQLMGEKFTVGDFVDITGQFRSQLVQEGDIGKKYNKLFVFASMMARGQETENNNENEVGLTGIVVRVGNCRPTPSGREITDFTLKVERDYRRYDYIPCVAWGRKAKAIERLKIGTGLKCSGRIQAREQNKRLSDDSVEKVITFEVSCNDIEIIENVQG